MRRNEHTAPNFARHLLICRLPGRRKLGASLFHASDFESQFLSMRVGLKLRPAFNSDNQYHVGHFSKSWATAAPKNRRTRRCRIHVDPTPPARGGIAMNMQVRTASFDESLVPSTQKAAAQAREPRFDWQAAAILSATLLNLIWIGFLLWLPGHVFGAW
jgi:hypothetical protein